MTSRSVYRDKPPEIEVMASSKTVPVTCRSLVWQFALLFKTPKAKDEAADDVVWMPGPAMRILLIAQLVVVGYDIAVPS